MSRPVNLDLCFNCNILNARCKGLCKNCYQKDRRKTPEVKARLKLYNDTKGVIARKNFLAKQPKKEYKEKQTICSCGNKVIAKGLCSNCYQKKYQHEKFGVTPRNEKTIPFVEQYQKVLQEVKKVIQYQKPASVQKLVAHGFIEKLMIYKKRN